MKKIIIIWLTLCAFSCKKNISTLDWEGTLTGVDYTLCVCCGGVVLEIQNLTGNFRVDSLPFMSVQKLHTLNFPVRIQFDYSRMDTCGSIIRPKITSYFIGD